MTGSPLITRPGYGAGRAAIPVSESKLPSGGPGGKGMPLDPGIPGSATFSKPEDDIREDGADDEPIKRVDGPDDLLKDRSRIDTREDNADKHDGIGEMGKGEWDTTIKTKYPYRDDRPNQHYAMAEYVAGVYLLKTAFEVVVPPAPMVRTAATLEEMEVGLDPKIQQSAAACSVTLKRADAGNLRWLFTVNCGNGAKVVRIKANRAGNIVKFTKLDLTVTCSCPAWQWQGPEYHAKKDQYLDGKPRGTASTPDIRDPLRVHRLCKHVTAVLSATRGWQIPTKKG